MAVIFNPNQNTNNQSSNVLNGGGPSGQPQNPFQQKASGRFTNIQKYIGTNQPAAGQLQSRVERYGGQQQQKAEKDIEPGLSSIRQGITEEKDRLGKASGYSEAIKSGDVSRVESLAGIATPTQQVSAQPLVPQADQSNFNNLQQILSGQTKAGEIQAGISNVLSQAQMAAQKQADIAKSAQTEQGRFGLLKSTIGSGKGYTGGQGLLDNLILQSSGKGALAGLQQGLQGQAQVLGQKAGAYETELSPQAQAIRDQQEAAKADLVSSIGGFDVTGGGALGSLYGGLTAAQQQADTERNKVASDLRKSLETYRYNPLSGETGSFTQDQLNLLGLSGGERAYNTDLKSFAANIKSPIPSSMADVASPEQMRMKEALARLSGQEFNLGEKNVSPYVDTATQQQLKDMFKSAEEDFNKKRVDFVTGGQYDEYGSVGLTAQEAARLSQNPDQLNQYAEAQRNKAIAERDRYLPLNQSGNMFINNPYYTYGNERVNQLSNENVRNMISKFLNESGYNNTMYRR